MRCIDIPFELLKNDWIWYPTRSAVLWLQEAIIEAMKKYDVNTSDEELETSSYAKKYTSAGKDPHLAKLRGALELWASIEKHGFSRDKSSITVNITDEGRIQVIDGFHRINILDFLDYKGLVRLDIVECGQQWEDFKDKLVEMKSLYTPIPHPDVSEFICYRVDSGDRLKFIRKEIGNPVDNIADLGSCEGYMSFGLFDMANKSIHAVEANKMRCEVSDYLNRMYNRDSKKITFHNCKIEEYMSTTETVFDVGIFLSTFHHSIIHNGDRAWSDLKGLSEKVKVLFFDMAVSGDKVWSDHESLKGLTAKKFLHLIYTHWGYNKHKALPVKTVDGRTIFKFWRE